MKKLLLLCIPLVVSACDFIFRAYDGDPIKALEQGSWDFESLSNTCINAQHTFKFSPDMDGFVINFKHQPTGQTAETIYRLDDIKGAVLSTYLESENRRDDDGNLVSWELIVNSEDRYFWRRSDWEAYKITEPIIRCT